jgi:AraC family transcriptional regulator
MLRATELERTHPGWTERLFTEVDTNVGLVQIVDNILHGSEVHGCDDHNVLRWRMAPNKLGSPGSLGGGDFVPFGKMMFFPAAVPYRTRSFNHSEHNRMVLCWFKSELDDMLSELAYIRDRAQLSRCLDIDCGRIDVAMQRIHHELTHPGFATELLVESLLTSLAVDICRHFNGQMEAGEALGATRGLSDVHLRRVTDFIISAREGVPTSAKLADLCGLTPSSFRQRFKQTTGQSIHAYVEEVRLARAKSYLTDTELSMKEIAYELGFTHQATFTTSFRRAMGVAPSQYRQTRLN